MGCCRQHAWRLLREKQRRHPDIEILLERVSTGKNARWWVNPDGLKKANEAERGGARETIENRLGILESGARITRQKLDRLILRVQSLECLQSSGSRCR